MSLPLSSPVLNGADLKALHLASEEWDWWGGVGRGPVSGQSVKKDTLTRVGHFESSSFLTCAEWC